MPQRSVYTLVNAALAILDDAGRLSWMGTYQTWNDFLAGGTGEIFPGDGLAVNVPSQQPAFNAIVRRISIDVVDPMNDRRFYTIEFTNDLAEALALQLASGATTVPLQDLPVRLSTTQEGKYYLANLTDAQITQVSSTTAQVDAGLSPRSSEN